MDKFAINSYPLHYSKYMERSGRVSGTILIIIGLAFIVNGIKNLVQHLKMTRTEYTVVHGKIITFEKKDRHVKLSKKTDFYPVMEFAYNGNTYKVKSKMSFGEETMGAFAKASDENRFEVRVPKDDIFGAIPNYELNRNEKLFAALWSIGFGLFFAVIGAAFIINRPQA